MHYPIDPDTSKHLNTMRELTRIECENANDLASDIMTRIESDADTIGLTLNATQIGLLSDMIAEEIMIWTQQH